MTVRSGVPLCHGGGLCSGDYDLSDSVKQDVTEVEVQDLESLQVALAEPFGVSLTQVRSPWRVGCPF
ncbi:hypothetical protein [Deinococcus maricopensis]|uniref:Uncharacterized protein n=1 Tax=Deinococcus maricopensis (strain DSM 21211 / LMG 22137 / NRRL B-23946 / LB-34) TaxID=709986 RepID=E8U8F3_DEIML|nr:hypothetical protein [Deinococcus maricopensis]ADV67342.1 hypothetical protein Deima_1693 [Deinococcus maricopensis DSM 21211]